MYDIRVLLWRYSNIILALNGEKFDPRTPPHTHTHAHTNSLTLKASFKLCSWQSQTVAVLVERFFFRLILLLWCEMETIDVLETKLQSVQRTEGLMQEHFYILIQSLTSA